MFAISSAESTTNSTQRKPNLLMCAPEHFVVNYKINPWMRPQEWQNNAQVFKQEAEQGWQKLYEIFESQGVTIDLVSQQANLPDMVFTANAAVTLNGKALLSRFLHKERQGEEKYFSEYFHLLKEKGVLSTIDKIPAGLVQEGAGDCLWDSARQIFWAGYGPRSSKEAAGYIQNYFGKEVVALELATPHFYHADVSMSPLNSGVIVYYPPAFTPQAQKKILERVPKDKLIAVSPEDANKFVCNLVNIEDKIILARCSYKLRNALRDHGFYVIEVPVEVFILAGGSVCCLTLRLDWRQI